MTTAGLNTPFCDWVTTSFARDQRSEIERALRPVLDSCGFQQEYTDERTSLYRSLDGTVHMSAKHGVFIVSTSGAACDDIRVWGAPWGEYLAVLGSFPHRVTMLHATMEVAQHGPVLVQETLARANRGEIQLTRKHITAQDVRSFMGTDARGETTGTVYIGKKQADAQLVVYDKRHERELRGYVLDPLTRYEIRLRSGVGVTLHDVYDPTDVFWHFASRGLLPAPHTAQPWLPRAEGFTMPTRLTFAPAELMAMKLDRSPDVDRLLELAREAGPHGIDLLLARLRARYESAPAAPGQPQAVERPQAGTSGVH